MKKIVLGILAHVDAGKTTLAEGILHACGTIRKAGRVDHKDAFLDNGDMERARGITIFSKQARVTWKDCDITILDTPGHVDFSAEMERTLQVLDYALLVIDGKDGVQGDVHTLWQLLGRYRVPVFIFVNKMDQPGTDREAILAELKHKLDNNIMEIPSDIASEPEAAEELAMCSEQLMEEYLENGSIDADSVNDAICERKLFPCFFGSALKEEGITELLDGINSMTENMEYPEEFGARVYKIGRDASGARLTYMKVTGGTLKVKMMIGNRSSAEGDNVWEEKADQLRLYNGAGYQMTEKVEAGDICAVTGLLKTFAGQGLGIESENSAPVLEPVITYRLILNDETDPVVALGKVRQLEEEEPELHVTWQEESREIHIQVMGQVQMEILKSTLADRFGIEAEFDAGSIVYKETLAEPVVGIGHFEPLRHYAEVHLLMEPGERGSGVQIASLCSSDELDKNWQRLILTHLEERIHPGVLTGSELTDVRIILIAGRAHDKHTEGGDFRQATYRAVRQGLRSGRNILLEPWFDFRLEVPADNIGKAMSDVTRMHGEFEPPVTEGDKCILTGSAPAATMRDYSREVTAYTRGHGRLTCTLKGYEPCHNAEEVIAECGYDPEADIANPTGSVFCAHGAGFVVPWYEVRDYAHVEDGWKRDDGSGTNTCGTNSTNNENKKDGITVPLKNASYRSSEQYITQEEIEEIFRQTYRKKPEELSLFKKHNGRKHSNTGSSSGSSNGSSARTGRVSEKRHIPKQEPMEEYLLVDGYNIIFAWPELNELSKDNLDSARRKLMDILCNYQGYKGCNLILVFDAYKVKGNPGSVEKYHNIYVVYTKEAETADQYIEKTVHDMHQTPPNKGRYRVTVATSDALEQMIVWGNGAQRISALGFKADIENASQGIKMENL
ncbi:MAG: TetM/TetW/TetO/TetS family tetracycline resistance ribosomal protection protein [Clostridia bacterium]|nr:TetM/TetW/TetO/TetS family tetracycline resistance ribosomal protection protein [[Bacteroides] pectinophilus]MDD5873612.1 TetM/TetW/TetO/TetS family tetracycline resistance ribosomal protection protein [Clostridia bacterium]